MDVITKELRKTIKLANQRISRLEKSGVEKPLTLVQVQNTLSKAGLLSSSGKIKIPRAKKQITPENALKLAIVARSVLVSQSTTVKGARKEEEKRKEGYKKYLDRTFSNRNLSENIRNDLYKYMNGLELSSLKDEYGSDFVSHTMVELYTRDIEPNAENVKIALERSIDFLINDILKDNGVKDTVYNDFDFYVDIAYDHGINAAIEQYQFDLRS